MMSDSVGGGGMLTPGARLPLMERLYSSLHPNFSSSPDLYMDAQPLDFSIKKGKMSSSVSGSETGEHSDSDRGSPTVEAPTSVMGLALRLQASSQGSESAFSFRNTSPDRGASPRRVTSPMAHSPIRPTHQKYGPISHAPLAPPMPPAISSALLAQLHANPLLFSTLKSALTKPTLAPDHHFKSYHPQASFSPPPADFTMSSPEPNRPAASPRLLASSGSLGMSGLGAGGLGGTGLGAGGLGSVGLGSVGLHGSGMGPGSRSHLPSSHLPSHGLSSLEGLGGVSATPAAAGGGAGLINASPGEMMINVQSNEEYRRFRDQMIVQVSAAKARRITARRSNHSSPVHGTQVESGKSPGEDVSADTNIDVCDVSGDGIGGLRSGSVDMAESEGGGVVVAEGGAVFGTEYGDDVSNVSGIWGGKRRGRQNIDCVKDDAYWERRRKNNEAAKRSRDARRAKEDEIAIRAAFLEQENLKLRVEVASLKSETAKLRCMLYNS